MTKAGRELIAACCVVIFGGIIVAGAIPLLKTHTESVGPGYLPLIYGAAIIFLGGALIVRAGLSLRHAAPVEHIRPVTLLRTILLFVTLVVYAVLLERLGYLLSTWLSLFICFCVSGKVRVVRSIAYALIFAMASYALFTRVLTIALPKGLIGF